MNSHKNNNSDQYLTDLANRIREIRKQKRLTLQKVAAKASITHSFLSQVECGKTAPSISSLKAIADALEVSFTELFSSDNSRNGLIISPSERVRMSLKRWKAESFLLVKSVREKAMEPLLLHIQPGGHTEGASSHHGEEFGIVVKGKFSLTVDGTEYDLNEGDSFYFKSNSPHSWENKSNKKSIVFWVSTPPTW